MQMLNLYFYWQDYRQKSRDWELQRKTLQKQVEGLESQRKTLTEKCDFMQVIYF